MYRHLGGAVKRDRLGALRAGVEPILSNNLLPYFTAHDVSHCDRVTEVIDDLIEPLQQTEQRLTDDELFVLYAAAYLHDVGMHYEKVGSSRAVAPELGGRRWEDVPIEERRDVLRRLHPRISAELVMLSVRNAMPPIGFQLIDSDHPTAIASLCEAHGIDSVSERYAELTVEAPGLRPSLLSGILRCADILEESRRRGNRARAESLQLPIKSQVHWWRHYYTADVRFNQAHRTIDVWFEFPPDRRPELSRIVPDLQFPEIQAELRRHDEVFAANGLTWFLRWRVYDSPYNSAETLPDAVLYQMLVQIAARREADARIRQRALANLQEEARPFLEKKLEAIRQAEATATSESIVLQLRELAIEMKSLGAAPSAMILMREAFHKSEGGEADARVAVGLALVELLLESREFDEAVRRCHQLATAVSTLPATDDRIDKFWELRIDAEMRAGFFEDGLQSIKMRSTLRGGMDGIDSCRRDELRLLQTELFTDADDN